MFKAVIPFKALLNASSRLPKQIKGYGLAMLLVFLGTTVAIGASLQLMSGPLTAIVMGSASQNRLAAEQLAKSGMKAVAIQLQNLYNTGQSIAIGPSFNSTASPAYAKMPQSPDSLAGATRDVGSYTSRVSYINGNTLLVEVTATVGSSKASVRQILTLTRNIYPLDNVTGATAAYGLRKLRSGYTGNAIRVRRGNTETDIGFLPNGDLDMPALLTFLNDDLTTYPKPLDRLTGAVAAYGLRKLRTAYTGNAITVRRSSDNTLLDIGFLPNGDLDTIALTKFVGSGSGFITTWFDQSGNGYHATQATEAQQPRIVDNGQIDTINGRPAVRGLGGQSLRSTTGAIMPGTGGWHYATVLADHGGTANNTYYVDRACTVNGAPLAGLRKFDDKFFIQTRRDDGTNLKNTSGASNILTDGTPVLISYERQRGVSYRLFYNGLINARSEDTDTDITPRGPSILGHCNVPEIGANAAMGELIVYSSNLSTANRQILENDQARYYNLTLADPGYTPPLSIAGSATAAFGLRKLRSDYSGSAIQVRRSDNAILDIDFDNNGNLNIANLIKFCGINSCFVAIWYDQSGNNRHATQATAANQPRIVNNGVLDMINGRPAIRFDGVNDRLSFTRAIQDDFSILACFNVVAGLNGPGGQWYQHAGIVDMEVGGVTNDFGTTVDNTGRIYAGVGNPDTTVSSAPLGFNDGLMHRLTMTRNKTTAQFNLYTDSNAVVSGMSSNTASLTASATMSIGAMDTNISFLNGSVSEVEVYGSVLSDTNRQSLESNQMAYYNFNSLAPDTGFVTTWYDQSSNNYHLTQTNALLQPTIRIDSITGRPTVYFNGVNYLTTSAGSDLNINGNQLSLFAVANLFKNSWSQWSRIFTGYRTLDSADHNTVTSCKILVRNGSSSGIASYRNSGTLSTAAITENSPFQATSLFNGSMHTMRLNGVASNSVASSGNFGINQFFMGGVPQITLFAKQAMLVGSVSEAILYPSSISGSQLTLLEQDQRSYHGTP